MKVNTNSTNLNAWQSTCPPSVSMVSEISSLLLNEVVLYESESESSEVKFSNETRYTEQ